MKNGGKIKIAESRLPHVLEEKCIACGACAKVCFRKAISFGENDRAVIFRRRCTGIETCGRCLTVCDNEAITAAENRLVQ